MHLSHCQLATGRFSALRFHGDHQPPKFIASQLNQAWWRRLFQQPVLFRFYPQCETCSRQQGPLVKSGYASAIVAIPMTCAECVSPATRCEPTIVNCVQRTARNLVFSLLSTYQRKALADAYHEATPSPLAPRLHRRGTVPSCVARCALDKAPKVERQ